MGRGNDGWGRGNDGCRCIRFAAVRIMRVAAVRLIRHPREGGGPGSRRTMQPCVYILASRKNGTLYIGVTRDLARRATEHRADIADGFTKRYGVHMLVYAEFHATMATAVQRKKQIKKWQRAWKIRLIEETNPTWRDLCNEIG